MIRTMTPRLVLPPLMGRENTSDVRAPGASGQWVDHSYFAAEGLADWSSKSDAALADLYKQYDDPLNNNSGIVYARDPDAINPFGAGALAGVSQRTYGFNKAITCVASVALPLIPAPNPDDISDMLLDNGKDAAEMAAHTAEGAATTIKQARRLGPSRLARIAKLERQAKTMGKAAKALEVAGTAMGAFDAYHNFKKDCVSHP